MLCGLALSFWPELSLSTAALAAAAALVGNGVAQGALAVRAARPTP